MKTLKLANPILTFANAKTSKGEALGYRTGIIYLAPHTTSGVTNTCLSSTKQCRATCLFKSGNSLMFPKINKSRIRKTKLMYQHPDLFWTVVHNEIDSLRKYCLRSSFIPAIRLNGTSDVYNQYVKDLIETNYDIQFYDYTKRYERAKDYISGKLPRNYHLTFSLSENNFNESIFLLKNGMNVAVVFATKRSQSLPSTWNGYRVVDGDLHDLRFLDMYGLMDKNIPLTDKGIVIGLRAKGYARKLRPSITGFVQPNIDT